MKIESSFVRSAADAADLPCDGAEEIALVGRSNVGKSSLINALVRQRIARTSAAPGKTRLANIYRIVRGTATPFYLVDLPGYGYARGDTGELAAVTRAYFGPERPVGRVRPALPGIKAALLLIDARHPGLQSDNEAWHWLSETVERSAVVATKIDKLARGERIRAMRKLESVFEHPVAAVSAVTGEGLDQLWILIETLVNKDPRPRRNKLKPQKAMGPLHPKR